jgi:ATP-dependent helicase/nuclease subunit A
MKLVPGMIPDAMERIGALDPGRSFIVQAPAGSGKTELLIQRILSLLAVAGQPEEVLAITFTRKAAGEMRERLVHALEEAAQPEPEADHSRTTWKLARAALANAERRRWRLLEHPARLTVQTIDGFCAALVRRMPWLSRFGAQAAICDDPGELYRTAAERVLALAERERPGSREARELLAHLDNRMTRLRDLLTAMLARRDQWLRHLAGQGSLEQRRGLERGLRSFVEEVLAAVDALFPESIRDRLAQLAAFAGENLQTQGIAGPVAALAGLKRFPGPDAECLDQWRGLGELLLTSAGSYRRRLDKNCGFPAEKKEPFVENKRAMAELLDGLRENEDLRELLQEVRDLPPVVYDDAQWSVLQTLVSLLPRAVAELWVVFRETGQADFIEVAQAAERAFGEEGRPTDLQLHLDSRIRHILVDEFQDTSWGQYLLLEKLTAGWQPGDGRTLFLVGDPMQSIYRFREAEVGLFLRARRLGIGTLPLTPLELKANFRSQAGIVDWVNRSFPRLFPHRENEALGGVPYAPSLPVRERLPGEAVTVHPFAGRDDAAEASRVAELVSRARRDDPRGTVAILVRARSHLPAIFRALRAAGLKYLAQEIDPLAERPVALDLLALTRALLHPGDRIAHLALLRAPWCGLSLADLHLLCGDSPGCTVQELLRRPERLAALSPEGRKRAGRVLSVLEEVLPQRGRIPLRQLVEGAWLALGGPACLDGAGIDDAGAVLDLLDDLDHGGDLLPFEAFAERLGRLYASPDPEGDDSLQVMTIHKAKGLEFDTVILPGLGRRPKGIDAPLLRWLELPSSGLLLAPVAPLDGQSRDPIYDAIGSLENEKSDYETARVIYVAATRARKRLHLLGHSRIRAGGEPAPDSGSFLERLWPIVSDNYSGIEPPSAGEGMEGRPAAPALRRLPVDRQLPPLATSVVELASMPIRPSEIRDEADDVGPGPAYREQRAVGTVIHLLLEKIAEDTGNWTLDRVNSEASAVAHSLARQGVASDRMEKACALVLSALANTLQGERGRWILHPHAEGASEIALSGVLDDRLIHAKVDRTFVDRDGVRWIIDYKTSDPQGREREAFLAEEGERYQGQLTAYKRLFQVLEPDRIVRAGLYFPLFDGWYELG